jgi:histidyl-tRNA synthetase
MYPQIPKPFKRYQIQPVWRADKPQKGRFREFYQCDIDVIGTASILADAEILATIYEILRKLEFQNFVMRINNRKILKGIAGVAGVAPEQENMMARSIDKFDKIGQDGVQAELIAAGIDKETANTIVDILKISGSNANRFAESAHILKSSKIGITGLREMQELFQYLELYEVPEEYLLFDLFLSRGLDYYTGPIYETMVKEPKIGSITGGGRYDNLIGTFSGTEYPATGCSIGLERIITVMEEMQMFPDHLQTPIQVLVTVFNSDTLEYSIKLTRELRAANICTEIYSGPAKLRGQFGLANDKSIPLVIIAGPEEIEKNHFNLKNMETGEQNNFPFSDLIKQVKNQLSSLSE